VDGMRLRRWGEWQGVAPNSLKFHPDPPCLTLLRPVGGPPLKRPVSVFSLLGHPTPYAYARKVGRMWGGVKAEYGDTVRRGPGLGETRVEGRGTRVE
jgi:hypothetical protein